MKRQTPRWIILGGCLLGFTLMTRYIFGIHTDLEDFLIGMSLAFMLSAFLFQRKKENKSLF